MSAPHPLPLPIVQEPAAEVEKIKQKVPRSLVGQLAKKMLIAASGLALGCVIGLIIGILSGLLPFAC